MLLLLCHSFPCLQLCAFCAFLWLMHGSDESDKNHRCCPPRGLLLAEHRFQPARFRFIAVGVHRDDFENVVKATTAINHCRPAGAELRFEIVAVHKHIIPDLSGSGFVVGRLRPRELNLFAIVWIGNDREVRGSAGGVWSVETGGVVTVSVLLKGEVRLAASRARTLKLYVVLGSKALTVMDRLVPRFQNRLLLI